MSSNDGRVLTVFSNGVLFGGIYDDRLLVKIVPENEHYEMTEDIPYDGAKSMYFVEDVDNKEKLAEIVKNTVKGLETRANAKGRMTPPLR